MLMHSDRPHPPSSAVIDPVPIPSNALTLGDLAGRIDCFHQMRQSLRVPDFSLPFNRQLYATYLSYLEPTNAEYGLDIKRDERGNLAEFIKSPYFGQLFVSRTKPGITRGNHYHHLKTEKFLVLSGEGLIRLRQIERDEVHEYSVRGEDYRIVDILPGYTHSITNTGTTEMITLFWSNELFNPDRPDTYHLPVEQDRGRRSETRDQTAEDANANQIGQGIDRLPKSLPSGDARVQHQ
jgi:UDP-2-acetamido-2,6-beta-L-arabino-hexul-4-ose reductase